MSVITRTLGLIFVLLASSFLVVLDYEQSDVASEPLPAIIEILHAGANGKAVFGEYLGGQNCPPCESGGSPSMKALKNKESDSFVYISYIASTYTNLQTAQAGNVVAPPAARRASSRRPRSTAQAKGPGKDQAKDDVAKQRMMPPYRLGSIEGGTPACR